MSDSEFKGVGHMYLRPGQWIGISLIDGAEVTVSGVNVSATGPDGAIEVSAMDRRGAVRTTVTFDADGKVIPNE